MLMFALKSFRNAKVHGLLIAAALCISAPATRAQGVAAYGNWSNLDGIPAAGNVSAYTTNITSGTGNGNKNATSPDATGVSPAIVPGYLVLLQLSGAAQQNGDATPDSFTFALSSTETFNITQANVAVAMQTFLVGNLNFLNNLGPPNTNLGISSVNETVAVTTSPGNAATGLTLNSTFNATAQTGNVSVNNFNYQNANLVVGNYQITAKLTLTGNANLASALNSATSSDFISTISKGLATSVAAYPLGLPDSRANIGAQAARAGYGVDGTGVKVGIFEPGNVYTTNTSLAGRVNIVNAPVAPPAGNNYNSEHALAVAGIIGSQSGNSTNAGVAPGVTIYSASADSWSDSGSTSNAAITKLAALGCTVINMSASDAGLTTCQVDQLINNNPNLTFVKSAGNTAGPGTITQPGLAYNTIAVGSLNQQITQLSAFSAYGANGAFPSKPDLVAPGEFIVAPVAADINADGMVNDFNQVFTGSDYNDTYSNTIGAGPITGTSFAAPFVSGAAALLNQFANNNAAHHANGLDNRVVKAVLLNSANRNIKDANGNAWTQAPNITGSLSAQTYSVNQSLNQQLGAGEVNASGALAQFLPSEINDETNNATQNLVINTALNNVGLTLNPGTLSFNPGSLVSGKMWDKDTVAANGTVDYLLGDVTGAPLRVTLDWDNIVGTGLAPLQLSLRHVGSDDSDIAANNADDFTIATTSVGNGESVKLFDFTIPTGVFSGFPEYYLQIGDASANAATFGLAIAVPEPTMTLTILFGATLVLGRRRNRGRSRPISSIC